MARRYISEHEAFTSGLLIGFIAGAIVALLVVAEYARRHNL